MADLLLLGDDGARAQHWEIGALPLAVGRDASADIVINDLALSRRHFVIVCEGGTYLLKDLNSQNGTWVDGRRAAAEPTKLSHHDCILAGRTLFLFSNPQARSSQFMPASAAA